MQLGSIIHWRSQILITTRSLICSLHVMIINGIFFNVSSIRDFIDTINANMRAMQSLATKSQIADGIVLPQVVSKLDSEALSK